MAQKPELRSTCVARAVSVERGGMGECGCARRLGEIFDSTCNHFFAGYRSTRARSCAPAPHTLIPVPVQPKSSQVKSRITLRDTPGRRQAGAMRPVRRAGWLRAGSCVPTAESCVGWVYVRSSIPCTKCTHTPAAAAHKHFIPILYCGGFLVPVSPA